MNGFLRENTHTCKSDNALQVVAIGANPSMYTHTCKSDNALQGFSAPELLDSPALKQAIFLALVTAVACFALFVAVLLSSAHAEEETSGTQPSSTFAEGTTNEEANYENIIILKPGESRDITGSYVKTTYIINEPGSYTISGQSTFAHVAIKCGDVNLYLADGLNISPNYQSVLADVNCPAIDIEDNGGTVNLISKPGAKIQFGSYRYAAAIQKDGLKTKLVFKTEDESKPGTINAKVSGSSCAAAIGAHFKDIRRFYTETGNMVFESGNIVAEGGRNAAGIGGAYNTILVKGITVTGSANIKAYGHHFGAGIGSGFGADEVDEINIEGGTIKAIGGNESGYGGAGIGYGGWEHGNVTRGTITISGGTITAQGGVRGAGIGGSATSCPDKILITGGTINAKAGMRGCGIGSGGEPLLNEAPDETTSENEEATLGDLNVYNEAEDEDAVAPITVTEEELKEINAHQECADDDLKASDVYDESEDESVNSRNVKSIEITGGDITATSGTESGSAGIGNSYRSDGTQSISIKGGIIRAYGKTKGTFGLGGGGKCVVQSSPKISIDISGGTIYAQGTGNTSDHSKKKYAIGTSGGYGLDPSRMLKVTITGGSLVYDPDNNVGTMQVTPVNAQGYAVYPQRVRFAGLTDTAKASNRIDLSNVETQYVGTTDVYNMQGVTALSLADISGSGSEDVMFYPWLNKFGSFSWIQLTGDKGDVLYSNDLDTGNDKDLYPTTNITLDGSNQAGTNGSLVANYGFRATSVVEPVAPGYKVSFYTSGSKPTSTLIMDAGGVLVKNVEIDGQKITDDLGRWIYEGNLPSTVEPRSFTVYAQFEPIEYKIAYEVAKPAGCTSEVTGTLPSTVNAKGGDAYIIGDGGSLSLQGYKLTGWNTKADGSGTFYEDGSTQGNLTNEDGSTVTLYAQWEKLPYQISFDGGEGATGTMSPLDATIDAAVELPLCTFEREGYIFAGWTPGTSVGSIIEDGAAVINQCAKDEDGNYLYDDEGQLMGLTFKAVWINEAELNADACVVVTKDGQAVTGLSDGTSASKLFVMNADKSTSYVPFTEEVIEGKTVYTIKNSATQRLPEGEYSIWLDDVMTDQTLTIDGKSEICNISCSTVDVSFDQNIDYVQRTLINRANVLESNVFINGTQLTYTAEIDHPNSGYSFGSWEVCGVAPEFIEGTSATSNPTTIEVKGKMEMIAQSAPTEYFITFNANGAPDGSDISGSMLDQKCFCYLKSALSKNGYARIGYTFSGWNTKADGSGTFYENEQAIENLTTTAETVTLYAQWQPINYRVYFDSNFGEGNMDPMQLIYGQEYSLTKCAYTMENATFTGWNTERDGSGVAYTDGEAFSNLCSEEGAYVILYAQWEEHPTPTPTPTPDPDPDPDPDDPDNPDNPDNPDGSDSSDDSVDAEGETQGSSASASTGDFMGNIAFALGALAVVAIVVGASAVVLKRRRNQD